MDMNRVAIRAHRILAGEDLTEQMDGCVLVEDGRIRDIISGYDLETLGSAWPVIDLKDGTLLPGLFDCHSHLALDAGRVGHLGMMELPEEAHRKLALENLQKDLWSGVTTMRCMGDRYYLDLCMKDEIRLGKITGPDLLVCGIGMRSAQGHGYVGIPHTGAAAFAATSRENIRRGADHLKIFLSPGIPAASPQEEIPCYLTREEIRAVKEEAKAVGIRTTAHCIGGEGVSLCVQEGIDVIDHLYSVTREQVRLLQECHEGWINLTSGIVMDQEREAFAPETQNVRMRKARAYSTACMQMLFDKESTGAVRFTLGTDAYHGMLYKEIEYALQLGATRLEALKAVTVHAAEMTGTDREKGQIRPGFQADLIAAFKNPLTQENALAGVFFVMKKGKVIRCDALDQFAAACS